MGDCFSDIPIWMSKRHLNLTFNNEILHSSSHLPQWPEKPLPLPSKLM